jgi:hypothetical protein
MQLGINPVRQLDAILGNPSLDRDEMTSHARCCLCQAAFFS